MNCPNCGASNPDGARFCNDCGKTLSPAAVAPSEAGLRQCVECGRSISWDANVCAFCGHDFRARSHAGTEGYLMTGAVLTLVAGILSIALLTVVVSQISGMTVGDITLATISYACSAVGVFGGVLALIRKLFPIAVLGAVCAIFTPAFFFAIPGLALIARSASQFNDAGTPSSAPLASHRHVVK